jgi:DNA-binding transcriptional LysR family regulator
LPFPHAEFDVQQLLHEPLIAILPAEHRLAKAKKLGIADLSGEPLVLASRLPDPASYQQIEQVFTDVGAAMNVAYELENSGLAQAFFEFAAQEFGGLTQASDGSTTSPTLPPAARPAPSACH